MLKVISGKPVRMRRICLGLLLFIGLVAVSFPSTVLAYMYDQEEATSQLIVDKQLKTADLTNWQDNIPASQLVLDEGDLLEFRITIKNSGDTELENIQATDYLPNYLELVFHPGEFNQDNKQVSWKIEKLDPGEEKVFNFRTHIVKSKQKVLDGTLCLINKVEARAESGEYDQDTASYCIVSAKKLPKAGSGTNNLILGTAVAGLFALAGITLRKFGRGKITIWKSNSYER